jgi:ElaB/YqjD/DUF883 family membrane-anchored ribosome-binding protein
MPTKNTTDTHDTFSATSSGSKMGSEAKDAVSDAGRAALDRIDDQRSTAASGLRTAANALHDHAEDLPGGDRVAELAHSAADTLDSTANYVTSHDVSDMMADVKELVKKNPVPSLVAAAVVGFFVGRALSS